MTEATRKKVVEKARLEVAEAKKKLPARMPIPKDMQGIVIDTSRLKEKRSATTLLMLMRYGEE
jgi:hypothetical protein